MDCTKAESMVGRYINKSLSPEELELFLNHMETCSSCYDELETYFIVNEAIQQLNDTEDGDSLDFKELLESDLRKSRRYIKIWKLKNVLKLAGVLILCAMLAGIFIFTGIQIWEGLH